MTKLSPIAVSVVCLLTCGIANATPITIPNDLNTGDQYRIVFITSTTRTAQSTDIDSYNSFVTNAANAVPELAALGTDWKVIGSSKDVHAMDNTNTNYLIFTGFPIYRTDGARIADSNADLWDGSIDLSIASDENGDLAELYTSVWTGTLSNGFARSAYLGHQNSFGNTVDVGTGFMPDISDDWVAFSVSRGSGFSYPLYAMSGILTVPEPSSILLALSCVVVCGFHRCRHRVGIANRQPPHPAGSRHQRGEQVGCIQRQRSRCHSPSRLLQHVGLVA